MNQTNTIRGLWDLSMLCLLYERPMHPYEAHVVMKQRHKDDLLDLKRGSLYHAVGRLERHGLVMPLDTVREGNRPERTTYCITEKGKTELFRSLRQLIGTPTFVANEFMAALSFLVYLDKTAALEELESRAEMLANSIHVSNNAIGELIPKVGRINLLEVEYRVALQCSELAWVLEITQDIRKGALTWDFKAIRSSLVLQSRRGNVS